MKKTLHMVFGGRRFMCFAKGPVGVQQRRAQSSHRSERESLCASNGRSNPLVNSMLLPNRLTRN